VVLVDTGKLGVEQVWREQVVARRQRGDLGCCVCKAARSTRGETDVSVKPLNFGSLST
jgi:hypothetical protein